ncbi:hypothetical protein ACWGCW_00675 [Streptomyces sp. NPDC054933]
MSSSNREDVRFRERVLFDVVDMLRAAENGRPVPEHVVRHFREDARARAWRMIRRTDES